MRVAIMQPYFFPFIGYFQLLKAVDVFVFYDDVNFIKKGWINRNRILVNGQEFLFTIPCKSISQNKLIKDVEVAWSPKDQEKFVKTLETNYKRAAYFEPTLALIKEVFSSSERSI